MTTDDRIPNEVIETIRASCAAAKNDPTEFFLSMGLICEELQQRRRNETSDHDAHAIVTPTRLDCRGTLDAVVTGRLTRDGAQRQIAHLIYRERHGALGDATSDWNTAARALNETARRHAITVEPF